MTASGLFRSAFGRPLSRSSILATAGRENARAEIAAGLRKHTQLLARNFERNVAEATLAGKQEAVRRKIFERRLHALLDDFRRFNQIAPLIDHAEREVAFKVPQSPQVHEVVAEHAMLEQLFNVSDAKPSHEISIRDTFITDALPEPSNSFGESIVEINDFSVASGKDVASASD